MIGGQAMKRDLDLVRLLLIDIENDSRGDGRNLFKLTPSFEGYAPEVVAYHFRMMVDGGLINGEVRHGGKISFRGVTYKGHDLIEAIREPDIWRQTKAAVGTAGGWTFDIIKDLATAIIKAKVKAKLKDAVGLDL
jgi:hypothetical protein